MKRRVSEQPVTTGDVEGRSVPSDGPEGQSWDLPIDTEAPMRVPLTRFQRGLRERRRDRWCARSDRGRRDH